MSQICYTNKKNYQKALKVPPPPAREYKNAHTTLIM